MPDSKTIEEFLNRIAQIESANKADVAHPIMQHGMHKGMQAIGKYGLMPLTIAELISKRQKEMGDPQDEQVLQQQLTLPLPIPESVDPRGSEYRDKAQIMGTQLSSSPEGQEVLAKYLASHLLERTGGDQDRAAYMWNMGHNQDPSRITPQKLDYKDYVQKFRKLAAKDDPDAIQLQEQSKRKKFKILRRKP